MLTGPLEDERYRHATDAQGRLLVPNAELMALELLKDSAPDRARATLELLKKRLLDYDDPALSAPQRRFLMHEVQRLFPDQTLSPMLAAEDLAARCLEAGPMPRRGAGVAPHGCCRACGNLLPLADGWCPCTRPRRCSTGCARGIASQPLPADVSLAFLPPGKEFERVLPVAAGGGEFARLAAGPRAE